MKVRMFYGEAKSLDLGKIVKGTYDAATKTAEVEFPEIIAELEALIPEGYFANTTLENAIAALREFEYAVNNDEQLNEGVAEWAVKAYERVRFYMIGKRIYKGYVISHPNYSKSFDIVKDGEIIGFTSNEQDAEIMIDRMVEASEKLTHI